MKTKNATAPLKPDDGAVSKGQSTERRADAYTVISIFSGGMGLDLGLAATTRFRTLACVEKVPTFCETIRRNKACGRLPAELEVFEGDIAEISPEVVLARVGLRPGELDLLVGGPPCQSFSTAGKRGTTQDPRGTLLWHFLRYVDAMRPKFFLMENVRGLLSAALRHRAIASRPERGGAPLAPDETPGSVVRLFAEDLRRLSTRYHMDCFEVNSVNYGAPQIRERALFIGNRFNDVVDFPAPTHGEDRVDEKIQGNLSSQDAPRRLPWVTLRDAIGQLHDPTPTVMDFSPRKKRYLALIPPGSNWRSLPEDQQRESMGAAWYAKGGRSGWWRRLTFDLPCPTLVTMPNHASTALCHPTETRALSLREYARIQEFPDAWEFAGTTAERYAQVGNAVPVRLGMVAGQVIAQRLDILRARRWRSFSDDPGDYRVVNLQSHVRTRQWFRGGKTFVWNDGADNSSASYSAPKTRRRVRSLGAVSEEK